MSQTKRINLVVKLVLALLIIPLGIYLWKFFKEDYQEVTVAAEEQLLFPDLPPEEISEISIRSPFDQMSFSRQDDGLWAVNDRGKYPADNLNVNNMIAAITFATVSKKMDIPESKLVDLCLLDPGEGEMVEKQSTLFKLSTSDGRTFSGRIGGLLSSGSEISTVLGQHVDGQFLVMKEGNPAVYAVRANLKDITTISAYWIAPDFMKPDPVSRISYTKDTKVEWTLLRDTAESDFYLEGKKEETFPNSTVHINYLFHNIRVDDVLLEKPFDKKQIKLGFLTVETFNGNHYKMHFAEQQSITKEEEMYQKLASGFMRPSFKEFRRIIFLEDMTQDKQSKNFQSSVGLPKFDTAYLISNEQVNQILLTEKELRIFERITK